MLDARGEVVGRSLARGRECVDPCSVSSARRVCAKVAEDADKAFEATVEGEDLANSWGGGGEIDEVCERVVQWECRRCVECCRYDACSCGKSGWMIKKTKCKNVNRWTRTVADDLPRRSYSWLVMHTHALFWGGNAKLDSLIVA